MPVLHAAVLVIGSPDQPVADKITIYVIGVLIVGGSIAVRAWQERRRE